MSKRNLFEKRVNLKPYEYPELIAFKDAIRHSYWLHSEFNYNSDIQDYHTNVTPQEKSVITKSMLAIAQIEVAVKRFWGDLYKYFPKWEVDAVGGTFAECHIEGTEALTPRGWIDFRFLEKGDLVCQFNPKDNTSEFVPAMSVTKEDYEGKMFRFRKRRWECVVTPNHGMLEYDEYGDVKVRLAKNYYKNTKRTVPFASLLKGEVINLSDLDRLKIACQADGNLKSYLTASGERVIHGTNNGYWIYYIGLKKERKIERLLDLIYSTGVGYKAHFDNRGYACFQVFMPMENYKSFDWVDLSDKTAKWCEEFIWELGHWDGSYVKNGVDRLIKYSTIDKSCADKVQAIGTLGGFRTTLSHCVDNRSENYSDVYYLSFTENRFRTHHNYHTDIIDYKGKVYCAKVPSGFLITRYKDTVTISHNSEIRHSDSYAALLDILGMDEMFAHLHEYPALMSRYDYIEAFMANKNESKSDFVLSLILFSLFVEHISLFGQFLVIMSFNKHKNMFKGISNAIEATSKEEEIHGRFGIALYGILKEEHPELFTEEFYQELTTLADSALKAEKAILHWIFEEGDLDFIDLATAENYIIHRYNNSLEILGIEAPYLVDERLLDKTRWFDEEVLSGKENDFFYKRSTDYSKKQKQITADDLF